jgi:hypothetical protein
MMEWGAAPARKPRKLRVREGRTNLGLTRDWTIWIPRSAKADLGAPAKKYGARSYVRSARGKLAFYPPLEGEGR